MAGEMSVGFTGRLTRDPEVRESRGGKSFVSLSLVHQARIKKGDEYADGDPWFMSAAVWARFEGDRWPENIAASLSKGDQVVVRGRARMEKWEARDGRTGDTVRIDVDDIAPSLQWATAPVHRNAKREGSSSTDSAGWATSTTDESWGSFDEDTPW